MVKFVVEFDLYIVQGCDVKVVFGGGCMVVIMDCYEVDWGMVERGWRAYVLGDVSYKFKCLKEVLMEFKKDGVIDQYVVLFVIVGDDGEVVGMI